MRGLPSRRFTHAQFARSGLQALGHFGDAPAQAKRPVALQEILPVMKQQQACLIQMLPHPCRRMQCRLQSVARLERRANAGLKIEHDVEPKRPEQNVPRRKR